MISYCKAKDWIIQDIYIDDGYTGTNTNRPALQALLKNIDKFDIVLVYKLDRLSRSQRDVLELVEGKFIENDVDFVSLLESFDTSTPFGRAMLGILAVFAQLDREMILERMKLGKERRAKEGYWRGGGNVPIGYNYIKGKDELLVDPYEAMQVKKVFELYLEGKGTEAIAEYMTSEGYKNNNGYDWNSNQVLRALGNKTYIGMIEHNGEYYEGIHDPIIDEEIFNAVQNLLDKNKSTPKTTKYLLGGIVYCKYCGARLRGTWSNTKRDGAKDHYYSCYSITGPDRMRKSDNCTARHWRIEDLEDEVIKQLSDKKLSISNLEKAYKIKKKHLIDNDNKQDILINKIKDIDNKIDKLMILYQDDKIPATIVSERIDKLYKEKIELEKSNIVEIKDDLLEDNFEMYKTWLLDFDAIWDEGTLEERRVIVTSLVERIDVGNTRDEVVITWNAL